MNMLYYMTRKNVIAVLVQVVNACIPHEILLFCRQQTQEYFETSLIWIFFRNGVGEGMWNYAYLEI